MKAVIAGCVLLGFAYSASQTDTQSITFDDNMSMDVFGYTDDSGQEWANATLTLTQQRYSSWTTDGKRGLYQGIGFGHKMDNVDCIICLLHWRGENGNFESTCYDYWAYDEETPPMDSQQDIETGELTYTLDKTNSYLDWSISFSRKLSTGDSLDVALTLDVEQEYSWAWGQITGGAMADHPASTSGADIMVNLSGASHLILSSAAMLMVVVSSF